MHVIHKWLVRTFLTVALIKLIHGAVISDKTKLRNPVLFIPGTGGCRVYVRLNEAVHEEPELLWLNLKDFFSVNKITDIFSLQYDNASRSHGNNRYDITFPGWGATETVSTLDANQKFFGRYFDAILNDLTRDPFFVSNRSVRAAPYDFRRAPYENSEFFDRLKALVEETYQLNDNQRVVLIGHSMGCLLTVLFLEKQTLEWKKQYVKTFLSLNGPYGGTVKTLKVIASGENFHAFFRSPLVFRKLQRSFSSLYLMTPDPRLWSKDELLIVTHNTTYTIEDYQRFFQDIKYPLGYQLVKNAHAGIDLMKGPTGVDEIYCIYGTGIKTTEQLVYAPPCVLRDPFPDQDPHVIYGDGDGSVNLRSLEVCREWNNTLVLPLQSVNHMSIMRDWRVLRIVRQVVGIA